MLPAGEGGATFVAVLSAALAEGGVERVIVVGRPGDRPLRDEVTRCGAGSIVFVENPDADQGQLSSVLAGLAGAERLDVEGVLLVPVDVPLVSAAVVRQVIEAHRLNRKSIVRAVYGGRHGHPVIFPSTLFDELRAADPAVGARQVVRSHQVVNVEVEEAGVVEDIDTPADYARLFGRSLE